MKNSLYKTLFFSSLFFLFPLLTHAQGACTPGSIVLNTQADIDDFEADYGTCNQLNNLTIRGADITNLNGLSNIKTISNDLLIQRANNLTDLSGLSNLETIGSSFIIEECPQITNLDAFLNLTSTISEIRIRLNNNLTSIAGLINVPFIRIIRIAGNPKLAECCSIHHLIIHPNVEIIAMNGNAGNCTENGIKADPASATIRVVKNGGVIEGGVICEGVAVQLRASSIFKYQWEDHSSLSATDISNPTIMPTETTTYSVTITGCNEQVATKSITVTPLDIDRVYVKPDATGNNDGTTWEHAFTELQPAINRACEGTEIWVAAGTYFPTEIPYDAHNGNGRLKTFHLSKNVRLYGGFEGTETQLSERNPAANKTILDANGGYHALIMINLSANAIVDGLTIQNANGNGSFTNVYAGGGFFHSNVGGVFMRSSDVQINNCIFKNNRGDAASAIIIQSNANPTLINCLFFDNPEGAAIYSFRNSNPKIINCTITDNQIGTYNRHDDAAPQYTNTIIYNNGTNVIITESSVPTFKNCLVEDSDGSSNWSINGATDLGGNIDADPLFVDAASDDFALKACSPAADAGDNAANTTSVDLANQPRIFDEANNGIIDMGAYELQRSPFNAITATATDATCQEGTSNANNDGKITISSFAASDTYQYSTGTTFDENNASPATPTTIPNDGVIVNDLANANQNYTVRITNTEGCTIDRVVNLTATSCDCTEPALADIPNQSECDRTGSVPEQWDPVQTSVTNGVSVTYQWYNDNGTDNPNTDAISGQTTRRLTALPTTPGSYTYRVEATRTDDVTCTASQTVTLVILANPVVTITSSAGNSQVCEGDEITFTASGGTEYEFFVNNTSVQTSTMSTYQSSTLSNGDAVKVTVTNSNSCSMTSATLNANIGDNEKPVPNVANLPNVTDNCAVTVTAPTATDNCKGTITATTTDPLTYDEQGTFTITWTYDDGNGNTETQTQQVNVGDCNINNIALDFDGQNDNVLVEDFLMPTSFSLEAFINYNGQYNSTEAILAYNGNALFWGFDDGFLRLFGTDVKYLEPFPTNVWKHIAVTFDNNTKYVTLYVDGQQVRRRRESSYNPLTGGDNSNRLGLGDGLPGFRGHLDEVKIWNYVLSPTEVSERMECKLGGHEEGLELYFDFNEGLALGDNRNLQSISDKSSNNYVGTLSNFSMLGSASNFVEGNPVISEACEGSLAVDWLNFSTQAIDNQHVALDWQVANEINTTHYEIERSADGKTFETLGKVATNGDLNYQFADKNPLRGDNFYRVKEVENNGRFSFSETQLVQLKSTASTLLVYPNPTADVVQLQLPSAKTENAVCTLIDIHGKTILQQNWSAEVDLSTMPSGVYLLQIKTANGEYQQRIVKQ